ncbi:hypothetical protein F4819DRAFT_493211 [Hypoxylon fuscum]|nr:hypothetical protein F4819DRAFT_493211 [Hypoxylon fuscum]
MSAHRPHPELQGRHLRQGVEGVERGQGLAVRAREAHARNARRREPDPGGDGRDRAGRHLARVHVRQAATSCEAVDLIAVHRYGGSQSSNAEQRSGGAQSWASQAGGKLVFVEEWGVDTGEDDATSKLPAQAADINKAGLPSLYWQNDAGDKFGIFVEGDTDIAAGMKGASSADAI